ncbi:MAG: glutamate--tRNA ligase [Candidatus Yanofskybacteria bacterium RIFCSPLOWO2_02_FULL_43_10]|uniref:Glutamate--tRNA ligase n=1 Tax=Candidatus Yanofskybacteria bacterium RIFCSPLOWO2_12_FULL_43_11b TaxID=1802710 RepID=A0A1F8H7T7_9BACT|nr:MAG: glutamate--tRNA ligase [Candidatus Yanofskybacteria bacterium RIFCSPHIGHO2_01_FULL_43_32]OGN11977.1 MAG: glutamate--tRNA ligase [Candidatus Yanofskybacteria bacterium RIFCSPHIGHO2_02_FULL_43_12]OGN17278.1 MAG: glutamate--tRNA ligase [Candidatus Yanofskybacteria bacterium RIFCSPHIGHO2_12_FULL_43_11]OGN24761.1 MAG: glutamate--tRNA ligase [Candidatus Yanofskybacteria bacterium RIFCSPLOWO2_01_FULL_43_46]OGN30183.1 MAG: glutamate--tRNA ligase [Candidatus Yanofskybacteria bacterium RIFCSPLOWO
MKVKVRIAPSPTGFLHIGTAQSALYNWLFAHKNGGEFHLRIEDTDKERSTKEYEQSILDALEWLGLKWDGKVVRQSENTAKYREVLEQLLSEGKVFYCHHTKDELEAERQAQEGEKVPPQHVCNHKDSEKGTTPGGIIRLAVTRDADSTVSFEDEIRGHIEFKTSLLGDFSIAKSLDEPLYNFAVVVDDADMEITHVIRGEDHISNTPKQILIYEALGLAVPKFAHLPLILGSDKSKLSKRHGNTAAIGYKKDYLPEAVINFLGTLSHTFSKEIMTKKEMIEEFEFSKVHKSGAVFDVKKLNWINSQWVKNLDPAIFWKIMNVIPGFSLSDDDTTLITERLERLSDAQEFSYFWKEPEYDKELLKWKKADLDKSIETLTEVKKIIDDFDFEKGKDGLRKVLDEFSVKVGDKGLVYWPFRVALTGREKSPDPVDIAFVLGKEKTLERVEKAARLSS